MENVQHLSKGIIASTQTFCDILDKKLKYLNPTSIHFKCLKKLLQAAEDVSTSSLQLAKPFENNLEKFQEKTAGFLELMLEVILVWDQEVIVNLKNMTENIRKALVGLSKTQVLHEMVAFYKVWLDRVLFGKLLMNRFSFIIPGVYCTVNWIWRTVVSKSDWSSGSQNPKWILDSPKLHSEASHNFFNSYKKLCEIPSQ